MSQGDGVYPHEDESDWKREEPSSEENATDPSLAPHLEEKPGRDEATDTACQAVKNHHTGKDGTTAGG